MVSSARFRISRPLFCGVSAIEYECLEPSYYQPRNFRTAGSNCKFTETEYPANYRFLGLST